MNSNEWHFHLHGDEVDLNGAADLFSDEVTIARDGNGQMQLIMSLPLSPSELQAARDAAEELLAKVNAIAQIVYGNHENLRIGAVGHKDPIKGSMQYFISGQDTIRVDARFGTGGIVTTSGGPTPPKKLGDQFISAADKDEHLERALFLYGSLPLDWRGLYMVLEAAEDKHGGEKGLIAKNWVPEGQIKDFKATANSYKALRLAARHGSLKIGVEQARQTLKEARRMVRALLEKWCREST